MLGTATAVLLLAIAILLGIVLFARVRTPSYLSKRILKSERQLRLITDALPVLVSYIDRDLCYRFNNKTYETTFGRKRSDVTGKHVREMIGEENFLRIKPYLLNALDGKKQEFEFPIELSPGQLSYKHITLLPDFTSSGAVKGLVTLTKDITEERRQTEQARMKSEVTIALSSSLDLKSSLEKVAEICTTQFADLCIIDLVDDHGAFNHQAWKTSEPQKQTLLEVMATRFPLSKQSNEARNLRSGEARLVKTITPEFLNELKFEPEHQKLVESLQIKSGIVVPLKTRNKHLGSITLCRTKQTAFDENDFEFAIEFCRKAALAIDNLRLYKEARDANRAKDQFLATLSHELRTPMNVILGWLEILSTEDVDDETYDVAIETLNRNAKTQIQLISDLLDVSRAINGKIVLEAAAIDLVAAAREAFESMKPAAKNKKIDLQFDSDASTSFAMGDKQRIHQVLANLVSNALKFTPEGGRVSISIEANLSETLVRVTDTGQGIDPNFLPYVFERFRQETPGGKMQNLGGLGLGLSIVRYLTELHGGRVGATSEGRGKGASFYVAFPTLEFTSDQHFPMISEAPRAPDQPQLQA